MDQLAALQRESRRLDRFELFRSTDLGDARENVTRALTPHRLQVAPGGHVDARLSRARIGTLDVLRLCYGAEVAIDPEPLESCVLLQLVLAGQAEMRWGRTRVEVGAGDGVILDSLDGAHLDWSSDCEQIIVPLQRAVLVVAAETMSGRAPHRFAFEPRFRLDQEQGSALADLMRYLLAQACGTSVATSLGASLQLLLAQHLLAHHAHGLHPSRGPVPRHVRLAEQFIDEHAELSFSLADLARAAGTTVRTLCTSFQRFRGTTPFAARRDLRLDRARASLRSGYGSVTDTALRFQFHHAGRFAAAYQQRFGEKPSDTLQRAVSPN